jgi:hypothetical protein
MITGSGSGEGGSPRTDNRNQFSGGDPAWEDAAGGAAQVLAEEARPEDDRVSYWLQDAMAASGTAGSIVLDSARDTVMLVRSRTFFRLRMDLTSTAALWMLSTCKGGGGGLKLEYRRHRLHAIVSWLPKEVGGIGSCGMSAGGRPLRVCRARPYTAIHRRLPERVRLLYQPNQRPHARGAPILGWMRATSGGRCEEWGAAVLCRWTRTWTRTTNRTSPLTTHCYHLRHLPTRWRRHRLYPPVYDRSARTSSPVAVWSYTRSGSSFPAACCPHLFIVPRRPCAERRSYVRWRSLELQISAEGHTSPFCEASGEMHASSSDHAASLSHVPPDAATVHLKTGVATGVGAAWRGRAVTAAAVPPGAGIAAR